MNPCSICPSLCLLLRWRKTLQKFSLNSFRQSLSPRFFQSNPFTPFQPQPAFNYPSVESRRKENLRSQGGFSFPSNFRRTTNDKQSLKLTRYVILAREPARLFRSNLSFRKSKMPSEMNKQYSKSSKSHKVLHTFRFYPINKL